MEFINANDLPAAGAMGADNKVIVQQGDKFVLMTLAELLGYMASANVETDPTLTMESVAAEAKATGEAIGNLKKSGRAVNLLDNTDFGNPVNQRGKTSHTSAGYTIDRWDKSNNGTVTVKTGCVNIAASSAGNVMLSQRIAATPDMVGKKFTLAYCTGGDLIGCATFLVNTITVSTNTKLSENVTTDGNSICYAHMMPNGILQVQLLAYSSKNADIKWVAVYEGEYTAETLPEYQPKGYAAELAECMRYYIKTRNGFGFINAAATIAYINIPLPAIMRKIPSVASYNMVSIRGAGKYVDTSAITNVAISGGGPDDGPMAQLSITGDFSDMKYNAVYYEGEICLSADL